MDVRKARPRWILPPGQTSAYGWEYPCQRHVLFLRIFNPKIPEKKFCCEVYLDKVLDGDVVDMGKGNGRVSQSSASQSVLCLCSPAHSLTYVDLVSFPFPNKQIYLKVLAEDGSKILKIVTSKSMLAPPRPPSQRELTLRLSLPGVGMSMIAADEEEGRREIGFFLINNLWVEYLQVGSSS